MTDPSIEPKILKGVDAIQKRPGMYIGNLEDSMLNMLWEVISNSMDQFLAHKCTEISICIKKNNEIEVTDNGQGIAVHNINGKSFVETVLTELHFGGNFDSHAPHTHVGRTYGVGLIVVNALSQKFSITTCREGVKWKQQYQLGRPVGKLKNCGSTNKIGTKIIFLADKKYFDSIEIDALAILRRINELCYLNKGLIIKFKDNRQHQFQSKNGIVDGLYNLLKYCYNHSPIIQLKGCTSVIEFEAAIAWSGHHGKQRSFANQLCTSDGGLHIKGLIDGLTLAIFELFTPNMDYKVCKRLIKKGLFAIINVNLSNPKFAMPTKDRLVNQEVYEHVKLIAHQEVRQYFSDNPEVLQNLLEPYLSGKIDKFCKNKNKRPSSNEIRKLLRGIMLDEKHYSFAIDQYNEQTKLLSRIKKLSKKCRKEQKKQLKSSKNEDQ